MRRLLIFLIVPVLSACATYIDSERDPKGTLEGLRYSLPAPFLVITPQSDGTLKTSVEMLPDPNRTYVLRTRSVLSSYSLDVSLENQMLKTVSLNGDSTAVADRLARSAGTVAAGRIEASRAAAEEAEADAEVARTARATAAEALREAELNLEIAEATHTELVNAGAPADVVLQARLHVTEARVRHNAALRAGRRSINSLSSANAPGETPGPMAAGPMIFRIVLDDDGDVRLVAVRGPTMFPTSVEARTQLAPPSFNLENAVPVRADQAGDFKFEATYNQTVVQIVSAELFARVNPNTALQNLAPATSISAAGTSTKFNFILDRQTPVGEYDVILQLLIRGPTGTNETVSAELPIRVLR